MDGEWLHELGVAGFHALLGSYYITLVLVPMIVAVEGCVAALDWK